MERPQCSVQSKIPCVLNTVIKEIPSSKRYGQNYCVVATDHLSQEAVDCEVESAIATEKFDGTCCHVRFHQGKPALWARLDRKPNKNAEKRFKIFQKKLRESLLKNTKERLVFDWRYPDDFRIVPEFWIPTDGVTVDLRSKQPMPDASGHIPGWIPVDETNKQYCWHSSTVNYTNEAALVLRPVATPGSSISTTETQNMLKIYPLPLMKLLGKTLELVGTNINGNPYNLGSKAEPFHILIEHGCIPIVGLTGKLNSETLSSWFESSELASVEGIVWHCKNGKLFKLHRHHLNLPWPLRNNHSDGETKATPLLCNKPIVFDKNNITIGDDISPKSMFCFLKKMDGKSFDKFSHVFENVC